MADTTSTYTRATGQPTAFVGIELKSSPLPGIVDALKTIKTAGLKQLMLEIGQYWHRVIMPKHFQPGNWQRYDIAPRTQRYMTGEKRRYGIGVGKHVALIYKGETLRRVTHEKTITSTSHQVTIRMNVPTYFSNPHNASGKQPDKMREFLQVNAQDIAELHDFGYRRLYEMSATEFSKIRNRAA